MPELWKAEKLWPAQAEVGEGPLWDVGEQVLWWVDILSHRVHRFDPVRNDAQSFDVGQQVGTLVCRGQGGLMLAMEDGFASFDPATNTLELISDPEADQPENRFNDGKCDPAGRFWAGTMNLNDAAARTGALYSLDANHQVTRHFSNVAISNGIVWTSDANTMYYIDTLDRGIDAFDYDLEQGAISKRRTVIEVPEELGGPDGMAIDAEDMLWVAMFGGGCVVRYDPRSAAELARVEVPASNVTACAFGGTDLDQLYITTARVGLDPPELALQPAAGDLFVAATGVAGVASPKYAG